MSSYDIEQLNRCELENEVRDKFIEIERLITGPSEIFLQFGQWQNFKDWVDDLVYSYSERVEEKEELEKIQEKYDKLQEAIAEVSSDIENIPELDSWTDDDKATEKMISTRVIDEVNEGITEAIKKLDELADTDWKPGYKKPVKKKKK